MTDPLTQWLDEMEAKARAATPGPRYYRPQAGQFAIASREHGGIAFDALEPDAAYIAALPPETVSALLECVRAADARAQQYPVGVPLTDALARLRALTGREG